jgi:hypothetical protein
LRASSSSRSPHDNITVSVARVLAVGPERRRETIEMSPDGRLAATVVMTAERRPSNTLPSDRPRDTSPTLVDPTVVDASITRSAPNAAQPSLNVGLSSPNVGQSSPALGSAPDPSFARPSIPAYASTHGRLIFWVAAVLCATIVLGITVWWLVR